MKLYRFRLTFRRSIFALAVLAIVVKLAFVLRPDTRTLVLHFETIQDDDGAFHGRWTFTSGRRWASYGTGTRSGEHLVVLDPPGSFDSGPVRFLKEAMGQGANRIVNEIDSRLSESQAGSGSAEITTKRVLLGNAGGTPAFSTVETTSMPEGSRRSPFQTIRAKDVTIPLPAKVRLGVIGGLTEVIEFR